MLLLRSQREINEFPERTRETCGEESAENFPTFLSLSMKIILIFHFSQKSAVNEIGSKKLKVAKKKVQIHNKKLQISAKIYNKNGV